MQQLQAPPPGAPRVSDICDADLSTATTFLDGPPHESFDVLRAAAPVAWQDERPRTTLRASELSSGLPAPWSPGFWAVTSHQLIHEVSKQPALFSSHSGGTQMFTVDELSLAGLRLMMLNMDPPAQTRLRRIVTPSFTPRAIDALQRFVADSAREIADDLVGVENSELAGDPSAVVAAMAELFDYAKAVRADRRVNPSPDIMSTIANALVDGERLTEDEFCWFYLLLIVAGNETTRNSLSGSVLALHEQGLWAGLAAERRSLTSTAVDELIRFVSPVMHFRRTAAIDTELGGQQIRAGDKVVLWYTAANRDPVVFDDPHALNLARDPNPHLAFGIGPHFCLGTRLARLQIATMLGELLAHFPRLRVCGPVRRTASAFINSIDQLPVVPG